MWTGFCFMWVLLSIDVGIASGNIVLTGKNVSLWFDDKETNFSPSIKGSGESRVLYMAEPLDAYTPLRNTIITSSGSPFALITSGGCTFDEKVRITQEAGFVAAIIYNDEKHGPLASMTGILGGIQIHAVFVSNASGETIKEYVDQSDIKLWITPSFENSIWSIISIILISLLVVSAVFATCFSVHRHQNGSELPRHTKS